MTSRFQIILFTLATTAILSAPAQARRYSHHHYRHHHAIRHTAVAHAVIYRQATTDTADADQRYVGLAQTASYAPERQYSPRSGEGVVGGRPAGCPHAFCGCEASRYVFGKIIPELNLAYNWIRKFPRTSPAPGMAAARSGHVFILISHVGGNEWLIHDGNSGGHLTREHVRSISGYVIVNPHAGRYAPNW